VKIFNKHFFWGMAAMLLIILLIFAAGYYGSKQMSKGMTENIRSNLLPPLLPGSSRIPIYSTSDSGWQIHTLDGKSIRFLEFKDKVVFVNFWATWCMPCVAELPSIQNLYDSLKNERISFLLISNESQEKVRKFVDEKKFSFPVYICNKEIPHIFRTEDIPVTYIINREGILVYRDVGSAKWDDSSSINYLRGLMQ
jgi:thiol-disulfide isomerase/thioredoxin